MSARGWIETAAEPSPGELARLARWLNAVAARADALPAPAISYLVVTPLGFPERDGLREILSACGAVVVGRRAIAGWPSVSSALYVARPDREALRRAVLLEHAWEALCPGAPAEAWALAPGSHARVEAVKHAVRAGMRHARVQLGPGERPAVLHPFHLADGCDAAREARRLDAALALATTRVRPAPVAARRAVGA